MEDNRYEIFIDEKQKIIQYKHWGILKIEDIGEAWQQLLKTEEFTKMGYNLLSDYSEADFNFSVGNTMIVWDFFKSIQHILRNKKEAVIATNPFTTAISILFENEAYKNLNFEVKTFTTRDVALDWLRK
ncbi:MAG: hypothetical protein HXX13_01915 [Bacteroidetes bacterium]|nr:hypothetical protein [Bacteroidota bacterium]